jgi:hypothetical protein
MDHRRVLSIVILGGAVALGAACTATNQGTGAGGKGGEGGAGASGGAGGSGAGSGNTGGSNGEGGSLFPDGGLTGGGGGSGDDCAEEAKLVYVIGQDNELYSFFPPTLEVKLIGVVNCPQSGGTTPFSMAIDRKGTAWILFNDGKIYHVDVKDASCVATGYVAGQQNFKTFGMGFVADTPGSSSEALYVADYLGKGLAKIDAGSLTLTTVGPWDQITGAAELTGTGDARLFGFFNKTPIIIAEIDKNTGNILSQAPQPTVNIGSGWAFAFWGGDFWLFTSPTGQSQIDRYSPKDGTTSTVKTGLGTNIVGAGVSTCAPVAPPK